MIPEVSPMDEDEDLDEEDAPEEDWPEDDEDEY